MIQNFSIRGAQIDMSKGHANGCNGVIVSGLVWLITAFISFFYSDKITIWSLLIGGALISPMTSIINKFLKLKGHHQNNPLKNLAKENTIWMIVCIPIAFGLSLQKTEWFFLGMLLIIGARYLTFQTLFGSKIFWLLGATIGGSVIILFKLEVRTFGILITGSIIEIFYGCLIYLLYKKSQ